MYCPKCYRVSSTEKFCTQDGSKLEPMKVCPKCKEPIWPHEKLCGNCGAKVENLYGRK